MISVKRAGEIVKSFRGKRILVVGDLMLDRYVAGRVTRISPEAPVPVVRVTEEYARPGGAANVALNVQKLGGSAAVAGLLGDDRSGRELMQLLSDNGIGTSAIHSDSRATTTVKTRILAERQQVVRVDYEDSPDAASVCIDSICARIREQGGNSDGIIIEDYGKGVICQHVVDVVLDVAKRNRIPVGFDPKDNHDLRVNGITIATPNYAEACSAVGMAPDDRNEPVDQTPDGPVPSAQLRSTADRLIAKWRTELLIVTLGAHGMYLKKLDETPELIPAQAREVFDVSGAGDTVIGAAVLGIAAGAGFHDAASLANHAAGVVVGKIGTATCTSDELLAAVRGR